MSSRLRGKAAIVGVGTAGLGEAPGFTAMDIQALAIHEALEDAGLKLSDVDGAGMEFTRTVVAEALRRCSALVR